MPTSRKLQLVRQKLFDRCVPLVHAVMCISLVMKNRRTPFFIARRWKFYAFSRNQLAQKRKGTTAQKQLDAQKAS